MTKMNSTSNLNVLAVVFPRVASTCYYSLAKTLIAASEPLSQGPCSAVPAPLTHRECEKTNVWF